MNRRKDEFVKLEWKKREKKEMVQYSQINPQVGIEVI
jgi:hypothetical protein